MKDKFRGLGLEECLAKKWPVSVVYEDETKELIKWFAFGDMFAKNSASALNNSEGPDKYVSASWEKFLAVRDSFNRNQEYKRHMESRKMP